MFCQNCGNKINDNSKFCSNCGASVKFEKKSKKSFSFVFIILSIFAISLLIPFGVDKIVDYRINKFNKNYKDSGIELISKSKSGYFRSNREVEIKIINGRYFIYNLVDKLNNKNEIDYKMLIQKAEELNIDWDTIFKGSTLSGNLIVNNYYLNEKPILELNLRSLSDELMYEIKEDKDVSRILLPLFDKKTLGAIITLDFEANIEKIKFKDINETFVENNNRLIFEVANSTYQKNNFDIEKFYINFKDRNDYAIFQLDDINLFFNSKNSVKFSIKDISLISEKFKFYAKKFQNGHDYKALNKKIEVVENFSLENIDFKTKDFPLSIDKVNYSFGLYNLNEVLINKISDDYRNNFANFDKYSDYEINNIFKFVNDGFNIKINFDVENLNVDKINSGYYSFSSNLKIEKNDLSLENFSLNKVFDTLSSINGGTTSFINFSIDENSAKIVMSESKEFKNIFEKIGYLENKKYSFEFWRENEKILLNNLDLPYVSSIIGDNHYNNKKYKSAIDFYKYAAENGNVYSIFQLAYCYDVTKDYKNAIKWYEKSIEKNSEPASMWNLALIYEYGKGGTKKDLNKAIKLYEKAAKLGYQNAINRLKK